MQVGVAQQWYDELDNLAFSTQEQELTVEDDNITKDNKFQDERVCINCSVNTSPGTSEVCLFIFCSYICLLHCSKATESRSSEKFHFFSCQLCSTLKFGAKESTVP
jgi:hypothetical protein